MPASAGQDLSEDNLCHEAGSLETKGLRDLHVLNYLPISLIFSLRREDREGCMIHGLRGQGLCPADPGSILGSSSLTICVTLNKLLLELQLLDM